MENYKNLFKATAPGSFEEFRDKVLTKQAAQQDSKQRKRSPNMIYGLSTALAAMAILLGGAGLWLNYNSNENEDIMATVTVNSESSHPEATVVTAEKTAPDVTVPPSTDAIHTENNIVNPAPDGNTETRAVEISSTASPESVQHVSAETAVDKTKSPEETKAPETTKKETPPTEEMEILNMSGRNITDEMLAQMVESGEIPKSIKVLRLYNNQISDVSPLSELKDLTSLSLLDNQITDISPLSGLKNLEELDLHINQISDISALSGLTKLKILSLNDNKITDISPLNELKKLEQLVLYTNPIADLEACFTTLCGLTNLFNLALSPNQIIDREHLEALEAALPKLKGFYPVKIYPNLPFYHGELSEQEEAEFLEILKTLGRDGW
ncbi:MAG: leucine-rich repeat domain-containing protein [Oscillospiraceae bacterium]|nr:leucine-rich repeat domain-containing protein [Oscillospiraceae bacterium]